MKYFLLLTVVFFSFQLVSAQEQVFHYQGKVYELKDVDTKPEFSKGMKVFYNFLAENYKVPEEEGISGEIVVTFVIEIDGGISDIKILRDVGFGSGEEIIRVLKIAEKWIPAQINGEPVRVLKKISMIIK